eukprot:TRINITY_DN1147_c0_g1_i8.p1 TRINITY_DN1147_c0_g1~~TRINITY_DN1147_c0_g1_i8.p1  ORF type:complete len:128 (-),score=39.37 TRINITY_DN1147_c0_g1_i8:189-572(-)
MFSRVLVALRAPAVSLRSSNLLSAVRVQRRLFADSSEVKKGTCKWFDVKKGYGFLIPSDGSPEVFVHQSAIHSPGFRSLREGEPVEFGVVIDTDGRPKATKVTGPNGTYVEGVPRRSRMGFDGNNSQ